jgi:hypothetical protein
VKDGVAVVSSGCSLRGNRLKNWLLDDYERIFLAVYSNEWIIYMTIIMYFELLLAMWCNLRARINHDRRENCGIVVSLTCQKKEKVLGISRLLHQVFFVVVVAAGFSTLLCVNNKKC